jgi:haloalkane dehalogenase
VVKVVREYGNWLAQSQVAKLYIHRYSGAMDQGRPREFCRTRPDQKEITVKGGYFVQEDSATEIGAVVADFVGGLRKESS